MDMFEQWIVNPQHVKGMDASINCNDNLKHRRIVAEHEQKCEARTLNEVESVMPALEACSDQEDEKRKE